MAHSEAMAEHTPPARRSMLALALALLIHVVRATGAPSQLLCLLTAYPPLLTRCGLVLSGMSVAWENECMHLMSRTLFARICTMPASVTSAEWQAYSVYPSDLIPIPTLKDIARPSNHQGVIFVPWS
eukprot:6214809-Pleurochrysis_carterae.AAC.3